MAGEILYNGITRMSHVNRTTRGGCHFLPGRVMALSVLATLVLAGLARGDETYQCYFGNTHAHTSYSDGKETPGDHFRKAKAAGYDFYAVTDHALAKHKKFTPQSYEDTKKAADECTDASFVAIAGFEFSEDDGPDGTGHLNAFNTAGYLDATGPNVNLPVFYDWLVKNHTATTAASFNHPGIHTYNSYDYLTPERRDEITMFEVITRAKLQYPGFLVALHKGWRVAPIAGQDGHGTHLIAAHHYRTGVLAPSLTRDNILKAMRARRVYCTWDKNLKLSFKANGQIMGTVLKDPKSLDFSVTASDSGDLITRMEIIGNDGAMVASKESKDHSVNWNVACPLGQDYYFVKVYTANRKGPDDYEEDMPIRAAAIKAKAEAAKAKSAAASKPATSQPPADTATAYSAPVWIERSKR